MADIGLQRRLLLGLMRKGQPAPALLQQADLAEWDVLNAIAAKHRLQPLLHATWSAPSHQAYQGVIPPHIRQDWASAYRASAMAALVQKAALIATAQKLDKAGMKPVALKGAWLAWHGYGAPAMRPMRDIDLLVPEHTALAAWRLLRDGGYQAPLGEPEANPAFWGKHLPPLVTPSGVIVEIHEQCWERADQAGHTMPPLRDDVLRAHARMANAAEGVLYPAAQDMLTHLIVHGVYSHWLDAGPLMLADIAVLVKKHPPDWSTFWADAQAQGWYRGAVLLFGLIDRWHQPGFIRLTNCPEQVPDHLLDNAPDLLLQSMERRAGARIMARLRRDGWRKTLRAKWAEADENPAHAARLATRRIQDLFAGLTHRDARRKSVQMRDLGGWLLQE